MKTVYHLTLSAMFLALCIILPFITGGVPQIGNAISPCLSAALSAAGNTARQSALSLR